MTDKGEIRVDCCASGAAVWVEGRAYWGDRYLFRCEVHVSAPNWFERRRGVTFEAKILRVCSRVRRLLTRRMAGHRHWQAQAARERAAALAAALAARAAMEELEGSDDS